MQAVRLLAEPALRDHLNYDPSNRKTCYACEVPLLTFLYRIGDENYPSTGDLNELSHLDGFALNFTHFTRGGQVNDEVVQEAYLRGAALIMKRGEAGEAGVDLILIAYKRSTKQYAVVSVQIKNNLKKIGVKIAAHYLRQVRGASIADYDNVNCTVLQDAIDVSMVLAVGSGGIDYQLFNEGAVNTDIQVGASLRSAVTATSAVPVTSVAASISDFKLLDEDMVTALMALAELVDRPGKKRTQYSAVDIETTQATNGMLGLLSLH